MQISVTGTELQEPALSTELPAQLPCALREVQLKCLCVRSSTLQLFTTINRGNRDPGVQEGAGSLPHCRARERRGSAPALRFVTCQGPVLGCHADQRETTAMVTLVTPGTSHGVTGDQPRPAVLVW